MDSNLQEHKEFMRLAVKEAIKGQGRTSPNPCVGALLVKDGKIISRGYHKKAGTPHAEINALKKCGEQSAGATMYVTLEPCSHYGKTPPCCEAVARAGIKQVIIGMCDPNPLVSGRGIKYLQDHGIKTVTGLLEEECRKINRPFIKHITTGLPWIILKAAVSLDGKLTYQPGKGGKISGKESHAKLHRIRDRVDAIMVGIGTVRADNPSLTTRLNGKKGNDPLRIIIDSSLSIPRDSKLFSQQSTAQTWLFCNDFVEEKRQMEMSGEKVRVIPVRSEDARIVLKDVFLYLGKSGVCSVLVEGGAEIHGSLLKEKLADEINLFQAPIIAGDGGKSFVSGIDYQGKNNCVTLVEVQRRKLGDDQLITGLVNYPE